MKVPFLKAILEHAATNGSERVIKELPSPPPFLSLTDAYKMYGRDIIKRWISEGLLDPSKEKDSTKLNRKLLENISKRNNRTTYLPVRERQ